ncbi:hypothetical protein ES703_94758 [subsurface metagenome]
MFSVLSRSNTTKGEAYPDGKASSKYRRRNIRAKGDQTSWPPNLHSRCHQLLGEPLPTMLSTHKDIEVLLLQFLSDFNGYLIGRCRTKDGSKAGGSAINKFNSPLSENNIISSA